MARLVPRARLHRLASAQLDGLALAPLVLPPYHVTNLARIMVLAVFAMGYNLAFGYAGLLSLGLAFLLPSVRFAAWGGGTRSLDRFRPDVQRRSGQRASSRVMASTPESVSGNIRRSINCRTIPME